MTDPGRPNILYIFSDQHAARVMGHAGDAAADTPNLDRLAREGSSFARAYCPSPVCLPSRMSMLTGRMPYEQNCWTNDDILDSAIPTWLNGLGAIGYRPILIGRMHSLGPDQMRGYVTRPIGDHSPNWPGVARRSLGPLKGTSGPHSESIARSGPGQSSYQIMDSDVLDASIDFLRNHAEMSSGEPFCLTASFMLPHPPYVATKEDFEAVKGRVSAPHLDGPPEREHPWIKTWRETKKLDSLHGDDVYRARCSYYALVRQLDRNVGRLLDTLEQIGTAENTLVVYVSDHGDHIGERGLFWKHTFYDESIRVPLIFRWPGRIPSGNVIQTPVQTGGLGSTILDLVGAPDLPNASMSSFAKTLDDGTEAAHEPIFIEYCTDDMPAWTEGHALQQRAVIHDDFKLIYYHGYPCQLFDLANDPEERHDLAGSPPYQKKLDAMRKLVLANWDPEEIGATIERRKADKLLLKKWAEKTSPTELCRWDLSEHQNYLLPSA